MSHSEEDWLVLLEGVRRGDDQACQQFWDHYGPLIENVAARHLSPGMNRRVGPQSIQISACRTFFRRAQDGEFEFRDADSLWRLLCTITLNKVREKKRFHLRKRRTLRAEEGINELIEVAGREPTPADEVAFNDELQEIMTSFDDMESSVVEMRLQKYTNDEIAERLECSERTVRRMMKRIQSKLQPMLESE